MNKKGKIRIDAITWAKGCLCNTGTLKLSLIGGKNKATLGIKEPSEEMKALSGLQANGQSFEFTYGKVGEGNKGGKNYGDISGVQISEGTPMDADTPTRPKQSFDLVESMWKELDTIEQAENIRYYGGANWRNFTRLTNEAKKIFKGAPEELKEKIECFVVKVCEAMAEKGEQAHYTRPEGKIRDQLKKVLGDQLHSTGEEPNLLKVLRKHGKNDIYWRVR